MKIKEYDAIVIGSGAAGYGCADWLYDFGVKNIAIIAENKNAGTSRNTGSDKQTYYKLSLAGDNGDSVYNMAQTLFSGGCADGDVALAEAANSTRCFMKLVQLGVKFPTNEYGEFVGYKTDHDPFARATSIGPYTSKKMTEALEASVLKKGITVLDGWQAVKILTENNRVIGVLCLDIAGKEGEFTAVKSPYVVLATGGPAAVYYDSVYPKCHTGNSSLALNAGAEFANLSEWQYGLASVDFRWNVSGTYQQVLPRYISVDDKGNEREFLYEAFDCEKDVLKNVFLKGYEWPFDVRKIRGSSYVDLLVYRETAIYGRSVYLDFTREPRGLAGGFDGLDETAYEYLKNSDALLPLPINRLKKMNPGAVELYREHGIDIEKEPLRIAVCAQHCNGGVRVDSDWQTCVRGLYAAGETAGTFGIFRPGGTALNSTQVGGLRAARHIAFFGENKPSENFEAAARGAENEAEKFVKDTYGNESTLVAARERMQKRMSADFSFLRVLSRMEKGVEEIFADLKNFKKENRWHTRDEISDLFKNADVAEMQAAIAFAMTKSARAFGSRGSGYVSADGDFMSCNPVPENEEGRNAVCCVKKENKLVFEQKAVRPLPERELWFEKAWNNFNKYEARCEKR